MAENKPDPWAEQRRKGIFRPEATEPVTAATKEKVGTTAGKDLGGKGKSGAGMPKQADYGDTAAWQTAIREWRAAQSEQVQGQKKAVKAMQPK